MANHWNHSKRRYRTFDFPRLNFNSLKMFMAWRAGDEALISWDYRREILKIKFRRLEHGVFVFVDDDRGYTIPFAETALTFGKRNWFQCPVCARRCGSLYLSKVFACRTCVKASYESQNGSSFDALATRIRRQRRKLWPNLSSYEINDLFESCHYWPKPKAQHWETFKRKRAKIVALEYRLNSQLSTQIQGYLKPHLAGIPTLDEYRASKGELKSKA